MKCIFLRIYANMLESCVKDAAWQRGFSYDHLFFSIVVMNQITGCLLIYVPNQLMYYYIYNNDYCKKIGCSLISLSLYALCKCGAAVNSASENNLKPWEGVERTSLTCLLRCM